MPVARCRRFGGRAMAGIRDFPITRQHFVSRAASLPPGWLSSKWKRNAASREAEERGIRREPAWPLVRQAVRHLAERIWDTDDTRETLHRAILIATFHKEFLSKQYAEHWMQSQWCSFRTKDAPLKRKKEKETKGERKRNSSRTTASSGTVFVLKLINSHYNSCTLETVVNSFRIDK